MKTTHIFISHSHYDRAIADLIANRLRETDLSAWIDREQILVGDDILERLGDGLRTTDLLIFVISRVSLDSEWCKRELAFVAHREITEKKILIVPIVVDDTQITDLPWYLRGRNISRVTPSAIGAESAAESVRQVLKERFGRSNTTPVSVRSFERNREIDHLIANVNVGDWESAQLAAIEVLKRTDATGQNIEFDKLLRYCDSDDQDLLWEALQTIESCVSLAPQLGNHSTLQKMASHRYFSVRSSAASICMDLANFAPDRVPVDILIRLSVFDEDWYVQAPANAALKTLARSMPGVLRVLFSRLGSDNKDECAHSAAALRDIARTEPDLLDGEELEEHLARIQKMGGNREAAVHLQAAVSDVRGVRRAKRYKYGL
jgi:hypothetical protein